MGNDLFMAAGATYSPCERYRYTLYRQWGAGKRALFIMLNPSTATEFQLDPTVTRVLTRVSRMPDFGRFDVANLFALRSTDPKQLYGHTDPIGPDNDLAILQASRAADLVVCGWGNHGQYMGRALQVEANLQSAGIQLHALRFTKAGNPEHPLYVPYTLSPRPYHRSADGYPSTLQSRLDVQGIPL
ncbi:MAG: DUF1643 domain-containing protein [Rhizobium sp.]|nr:MAG: DUF1643 domain-containing protein [Rhizobium sp.]